MSEGADYSVYLPQEILLEIFSSLEGDRDVLKSCTLVNKAWSQASRVHLFHSVDLSATLRQNDWRLLFFDLPFGDVHGLVRKIIVKGMLWDRSLASATTMALSYFATSLSSLTLSKISIADFADLASTISKFEQLRTLSLKHICWETNGINLEEPILPRHTFPGSVETLYLFNLNLGEFLGWLLAHPHPPTPTKIHIGPMEYQWKQCIYSFLARVMPSLRELGILLPNSSMDAGPSYLRSSETGQEGPLEPRHLFPQSYTRLRTASKLCMVSQSTTPREVPLAKAAEPSASTSSSAILVSITWGRQIPCFCARVSSWGCKVSWGLYCWM